MVPALGIKYVYDEHSGTVIKYVKEEIKDTSCVWRVGEIILLKFPWYPK